MEVKRNDAITAAACEEYSHILISPGPGLPVQAGITMDVIKRYNQTKSILGCLLGCQALAQFFGGELYNQNMVAHGIKRDVGAHVYDSWSRKGTAQSL
ncbi:MAG: hypothetical protein U5L96_07430 [Owenweeksia sp.]|nr:hypothetical protein [Owenweeksia sp.]